MVAPAGVCGRKFTLILKKNRREIHQYLFREGVIVVKKDPKQKEHEELKGIPNLHVMMALRSLKSQNFVTENFNWLHHYYILTNEGIEHLRNLLYLPSNVQPATHTRKKNPNVGGGRRDDWGGQGGGRNEGFGRGRRPGGFGGGGFQG